MRELAASLLLSAAFSPGAAATLREGFQKERKVAWLVVRVVVCSGWRVLSCSQGASAVLGETWADKGLRFGAGAGVHPAAPVIQTKPLGEGGSVPT